MLDMLPGTLLLTVCAYARTMCTGMCVIDRRSGVTHKGTKLSIDSRMWQGCIKNQLLLEE